MLPLSQPEGISMRAPGESSKREILVREGEQGHHASQEQRGKELPHQNDNNTHDGRVSKEDGSDASNSSNDEDIAPQRRRSRRSPSPPKRKRFPFPRQDKKRERKDTRKAKRRKRSPSSPSSSSSSFSSDESSSSSSSKRRGHRRSHVAWKRSHKLRKFKEGGKNITFLTYDDTYGALDKVLANNSMRPLEMRNFRSLPSFEMCPCILKKIARDNGGLA